MGRRYRQLSLEERCEIARLQADGRSIRQIAAALDRTPSTIARKISRNRGSYVGYKPGYAHQQTKARRAPFCGAGTCINPVCLTQKSPSYEAGAGLAN